MLTITHNTYPQLIEKIERTEQRLPEIGHQWSRAAITNLDRHLRHHLETQGRGGQPPPLSGATHQIYSRIGQPSGKGIRNHIEITYHQEGNKYYALLGIPRGRATMIAKVQDRGTVIKVTPKMRRFLHSVGVHLRADTGTIVIPARYFWSMGNTGARDEAKILLKRLIQMI